VAEPDRPRSPFAGMADLAANTPIRVLSPDEIERMLAEHRLYLHTEYQRRSSFAADLIIARNRTVVRCGAIAEVEHDLVHVTPSPAFRWVIAFDDRMARLMKMLRGMAVRRVVATADMTAGPA
jgi:hypothetical protein